MSTAFGPQLIGETEKALNALLRRNLAGTGLTEPQWVTLRVATQLDGRVDSDGLVAAVGERALFEDAGALVVALTERGLLENGRLTDPGRELVAGVQQRNRRLADEVWSDLGENDVAAAERVLHRVIAAARAVLAQT